MLSAPCLWPASHWRLEHPSCLFLSVHKHSRARPPAQGPLFFKGYTRYSARERMKAWDQRFAALVHMPQASSTQC